MRPVVRLAAVATALVLAVPAAAGAAGGATVLKDHRCQEVMGGTNCTDQHGMVALVEAGSGNFNAVSNMRFVSTFTGKGLLAGCRGETIQRMNDHQLTREGSEQQQHFRITYGNAYECGGASVVCRTDVLYSASNGEVRVDATRTDCKYSDA